MRSLLFDLAIACMYIVLLFLLNILLTISLSYMRPNTPHFVFGMENTICYGGHFYCTSTMQQTLSGVIHSFMLDKFLTNTSHQASRQLLRRILMFYLHGLMDKKISSQGVKLSILLYFC